MHVLALAIVFFCDPQNGSILGQEQCIDIIRKCYIEMRPFYDDDYSPAEKCMRLYDGIYNDGKYNGLSFYIKRENEMRNK